VIFENNQFLMYDFKTNRSWQVGDLESSQGYTTVAEDASIVRVIPGRHRTNTMQAIVSGGIRQGSPSKQILALAFDLIKVNAVDNYVCSLVGYLPELTCERYMH
jgi:hypothetical protein